MGINKKWLGRVVGCILSGILFLSTVCVFLPALGLGRAQAQCTTESKKRLRNISGVNVEITFTDCDIVAKEAWISVYAYKVEVTKKSSKRRSDENLLFRYDPGQDSSLPQIQSIGENKILISIGRVSSINTQKRQWHDIAIDYHIGKIDYPETQTH